MLRRSHSGLAGHRAIVKPFLASSLDPYLKRYWCVTFTHVRCAKENARMKRYANWYAVKMKLIYTDKLIDHGPAIESELRERFGVSRVPVMFVNAKVVGDIAAIEQLDEEKRLKDVLQFGLKWATVTTPVAERLDKHTGDPVSLRPLPARYNDSAFFHAKHKLPPVTVPAIKLPCFSPTRLE